MIALHQTSTTTHLARWYVPALWLCIPIFWTAACGTPQEQAVSPPGIDTETNQPTDHAGAETDGTKTNGAETDGAPASRATSTSTTAAEPPISSTTLKPATTEDVAALAESLSAKLLLVSLGDDSVVIWNDGESRVLAPDESDGVWSDGTYLYRYLADDEDTQLSTAATLDGNKICDADGRIQHVTKRSDGTYVMAVEPDQPSSQERNPIGEIGKPLFAVDCQTGSRQPIEPIGFWNGEVEWRAVHRTAGREFNLLGDAEGNADVINESGITVNGDDYAGYAIFNQDASLMAYGDMGAGAGPHLTPAIVVSDTKTGERLWGQDFGVLIKIFDFIDDRLVVWFPSGNMALVDGERAPASAVVFDAATGERLDELALDAHLEILHIS